MRNMSLGNSFPQICVVSVNDSVEISLSPQEYGRSMPLSNRYSSLTSNLAVLRNRFSLRFPFRRLAQSQIHRPHGEFDAVVHPGLAHEVAHMSLDSALLDA